MRGGELEMPDQISSSSRQATSCVNERYKSGSKLRGERPVLHGTATTSPVQSPPITMKFALAAAFISTVLSAVQALPSPGADYFPPPDACCFPTVPLLRAYNPTITDHFYTTNAAEMQNAVTALGYHEEGDAATIHPEQTPITVPLYRLYNPAIYDHFYTTSTNERDNAARNLGYSTEGITGYVYENEWCGTVPLYRMYNPSITDHFYTTNAAEKDNAVNKLGYHYEGIAAYVNPQA